MVSSHDKIIVRRLALGTAQLGMPYGVANSNGQPSEEAAYNIIAAAWQEGICYYDTARSYGESEAVLGRCFQRLNSKQEPLIITKLAPGLTEPDQVLESIQKSLDNLKQPSLWGVLLHREEMLDHWHDLWEPALHEARSRGLLLHAGVSVYSPARALQALECTDLDLIQLPANVFDRRMARSGFFNKVKTQAITVFIRSIYLQGLALFKPAKIPAHLNFARKALVTLNSFCHEHNLDKQSFLIHYLLLRYPQAVLLFGAETAEQVRQNCTLARKKALSDQTCDLWDQVWPEDNERLVNPTLW